MFERTAEQELFTIPESFDGDGQMRRATLLTTIAEDEEYLNLVRTGGSSNTTIRPAG